MGIVGLLSQLSLVSRSTGSIGVLLVGLAVGVDYSLLFIRREREERQGRAQQGRGAAQVAAAASGRAILIWV